MIIIGPMNAGCFISFFKLLKSSLGVLIEVCMISAQILWVEMSVWPGIWRTVNVSCHHCADHIGMATWFTADTGDTRYDVPLGLSAMQLALKQC